MSIKDRLQTYKLSSLSGLILLGLFCSSSLAFTGKVVGVSDGDTVTVLDHKTPVKVRLEGIDCPEKTQAFGSRAKLFTSKACFGKTVEVKAKTRDRYGRTIGTVLLPGGTSLNQELVRNGLAWWYVHYAPRDKTLKNLESEARAQRLGLWKDPSPLPPWDYRKNHRRRLR